MEKAKKTPSLSIHLQTRTMEKKTAAKKTRGTTEDVIFIKGSLDEEDFGAIPKKDEWERWETGPSAQLKFNFEQEKINGTKKN
jgi:hypothetical protein